MKYKATITILILIVLCMIALIATFRLGEKNAYSKIPEISLRGSMKFDEEKQKEIIEEVHKHIKANSIKGITYFLTVSRQQGDWIVFEIHPLNSEIDTAWLYVEIKNGEPIFYGPATTFPDLAEKYPELFK